MAGDLASSELGFRYGMTEANPVMRGPAMHRVAMGIASYATIRHYATRLDRGGHQRWATVGTWAAVGIEIAATAWNARIIDQRRARGCTPTRLAC